MKGARQLTKAEPACSRCAELEARCAKLESGIQEWQDIAVRANAFWRGFADEVRAELEERLRVEVWKRKRLRNQVEDVKQAASRRAGMPSMLDVVREYDAIREAWDAAEEGSEFRAKVAESRVAEKFRCTPRTVRRRLREFEDVVTRSMESPPRPPKSTDK